MSNLSAELFAVWLCKGYIGSVLGKSPLRPACQASARIIIHFPGLVNSGTFVFLHSGRVKAVRFERVGVLRGFCKNYCSFRNSNFIFVKGKKYLVLLLSNSIRNLFNAPLLQAPNVMESLKSKPVCESQRADHSM
jgi:hypothetical protein